MFGVLERSNNKLDLSVLKALIITKHQPLLCKQKEFYALLLFNTIDFNISTSDLVGEENKVNHTYPFG